jgi:Na+/H+ antiporter NhaD/arsenite permease-like protein
MHALSPFDGAALSLAWGLPFAGLLLSIAFAPLLAPRLWHDHYGKCAAIWALLLLVPFAATFGAGETLHNVAHAILLEYVPFLAMLFALFTIAGGICLRGTLSGTPAVNASLLALGACLASVMGTTGASMLLIRPLIAANEARRHRVHAVVFFILIVGNVGGALSPLGDPPLFIGFLKGVDFFWTTRALALPTLFLVAVLLAAFYALDTVFLRREAPSAAVPADPAPLSIEGLPNFLLLAGVIGAVLMSGLWDPASSHSRSAGATHRASGCDAQCVAASCSAAHRSRSRPAAVRVHNQFHWAPIVEVAKLFAAIFITIFPCSRCSRPAAPGALRHLRARRRRHGRPRQCDGFLADRNAVGLPRQRADLSRVLQSCRVATRRS